MKEHKIKVINLIYEYIDHTEGGGYLTDHDELYDRLTELMKVDAVLADVSGSLPTDKEEIFAPSWIDEHNRGQ